MGECGERRGTEIGKPAIPLMPIVGLLAPAAGIAQPVEPAQRIDQIEQGEIARSHLTMSLQFRMGL